MASSGNGKPTRVPLLRPLTGSESVVAELLGEGLTPDEVAASLHLRLKTVQRYCSDIAEKIPGTLPQVTLIVLWWRGAPLEFLNAHTTGQRRHQARQRQLAVSEENRTP